MSQANTPLMPHTHLHLNTTVNRRTKQAIPGNLLTEQLSFGYQRSTQQNSTLTLFSHYKTP